MLSIDVGDLPFGPSDLHHCSVRVSAGTEGDAGAFLVYCLHYFPRGRREPLSVLEASIRPLTYAR